MCVARNRISHRFGILSGDSLHVRDMIANHKQPSDTQIRYRCFFRHHQFHAAQHFLNVPTAVAHAHTHAPHTYTRTHTNTPKISFLMTFIDFCCCFVRFSLPFFFSWFVVQKTHSHKTVPNALPVFFSLSHSFPHFYQMRHRIDNLKKKYFLNLAYICICRWSRNKLLMEWTDGIHLVNFIHWWNRVDAFQMYEKLGAVNGTFFFCSLGFGIFSPLLQFQYFFFTSQMQASQFNFDAFRISSSAHKPYSISFFFSFFNSPLTRSLNPHTLVKFSFYFFPFFLSSFVFFNEFQL